jgi:hypothetical protein
MNFLRCKLPNYGGEKNTSNEKTLFTLYRKLGHEII